MKKEIIYKNIKNWYIKLINNSIIEISIPNNLKNDTEFVKKILLKAEKFKEKISNKSKLLYPNNNFYYPYWIETEIIEKNEDIKNFLSNIFYADTKKYLDIYSNKIWFKYKSFKIKDLKSKWGSCSYNQEIIINLKLAYLPKEYLEYVCAHEITHLKHKNHSINFYNELTKLFPDYLKLRKKLKNIII